MILKRLLMNGRSGSGPVCGGLGALAAGHRRGGPPRTGLRRGFTILEVMIVLVIILMIVGFVGFNLFAQRDDANKKAAQVQLARLKDGLMAFSLKMNRFPTEEEGLKALWDKSAISGEEEQAKWTSIMSEPAPNDPWGTAWGYKVTPDGTHPFELWSNGPDKQEGSTDDLSAWKSTGEGGASGGGKGGSSAPPPPSKGGK